MATAVLFKYDPQTDSTTTDVFSTPNFEDPVQAALNVKTSCADDFPGHLWAIAQDEEATNIMTNNRMHRMGFEDYDHAKMKDL